MWMRVARVDPPPNAAPKADANGTRARGQKWSGARSCVRRLTRPPPVVRPSPPPRHFCSALIRLPRRSTGSSSASPKLALLWCMWDTSEIPLLPRTHDTAPLPSLVLFLPSHISPPPPSTPPLRRSLPAARPHRVQRALLSPTSNRLYPPHSPSSQPRTRRQPACSPTTPSSAYSHPFSRIHPPLHTLTFLCTASCLPSPSTLSPTPSTSPVLTPSSIPTPSSPHNPSNSCVLLV